jgi:hypothetical protein
MLTTHKEASKYFWSFSRFCKFLFCFMHKLKSSNDTRYKVPLVGVSLQASFRLTAAGRGCTPPNRSKPSTLPAAVVASAPWLGSSHWCVAAILGWSSRIG